MTHKTEIEPCRSCGTWRCSACGRYYGRKNLAWKGQHKCRCGSTEGVLTPTRHRIPGIKEDHEADLTTVTYSGSARNGYVWNGSGGEQHG